MGDDSRTNGLSATRRAANDDVAEESIEEDVSNEANEDTAQFESDTLPDEVESPDESASSPQEVDASTAVASDAAPPKRERKDKTVAALELMLKGAQDIEPGPTKELYLGVCALVVSIVLLVGSVALASSAVAGTAAITGIVLVFITVASYFGWVIYREAQRDKLSRIFGEFAEFAHCHCDEDCVESVVSQPIFDLYLRYRFLVGRALVKVEDPEHVTTAERCSEYQLIWRKLMGRSRGKGA